MADLDINTLMAVVLTTSSTKKKKVKRCWIKRKWLLKKKQLGDVALLKEIRNIDDDWRTFLRMDETCFTELLKHVTPLIEKQNTIMRESISASERLIVTLRYLATGVNYANLKFSSKISTPAISNIVSETCRAIYYSLQNQYMKFPTSENEWTEIADYFYYRWGFPNCLGAVDGKHIAITKPPNSGAYFYNYKHFYSIVLLAIVNANYEFIYCHVGTNGRVSDGGVIKHTDFYDRLSSNSLKIPAPRIIKKSNTQLPFVFIGDDAFELRKDFLKPFKEINQQEDRLLFNKKICRARQVVENAFGILASRFRIFHTKINLKVENAEYVVLASCALHNFLRKKSVNYIENTNGSCDGNSNLTTRISNLKTTHARRSNVDGVTVRNQFLEYFVESTQ